MPSNKYELILAIVNEGLADDVMDVARECGVRGGTILTARGVTNEEAAAFFGISIHSEKEILMMVVEKSIKNNVFNAVYDKLEMSKKTKGIVFSLPVSAAAGLVGQDDENK
ncbi:MAG: P-II family nitrogen regulator [Clostridia bacterium]|nr:P-II family nitrogen regulator [Clostridia bacterium]